MRLALRKLTCVPEVPGPQPSVEVTKEFMMSAGSLRVEASLDKEVCIYCISVIVVSPQIICNAL